VTDPTDKNKKPVPRVEIIRKGPASGTVPVRPASPRAVAPTSPRVPTTGNIVPVVGPRTLGSAGLGSAPSGRAPGGGGFRSGPSMPRPPPTPESITALARKERVPFRIARGELEGKMKCRIWKKLHAEEAKRFDQAFTLIEQHPNLELTDAFGIVQSGLSIEDFLARRARAKRRDEVKKARGSVDGTVIDALISSFIEAKTELCLVLGERTVLDVITEVQPVAFECERSGRIEKLQLVVLAARQTWDELANSVERDSKLAQKPTPVARQPARRPVSDPRPLLDHLGKPVRLVLRNGITLTQPLVAVGPFDALIGNAQAPLFVPLHAMLSWAPAD
jgi:hypothetical protein